MSDDQLSAPAGSTPLSSASWATGVDTADYTDATSGVNVDLAAGTATGGAGSDTLSNVESVTGSDYDDTLTGDGSDNVFYLTEGSDVIDGGGGRHDVILAGSPSPAPGVSRRGIDARAA